MALTADDYAVHYQPYVDPYNGYAYVDLGLPSGRLWADRNVGANTPEDYGLYFQWGDTQGYTAEQVGSDEGQKYFDWADYKFNPSGDGSTMTKYNSTDGKTVLDIEDDAARANMGGNWRMPTTDEIQELFNDDYTTNIWTTLNGVNGRLVTSKPNGNSVFLPAAGYAAHGSVNNVGSNSFCWSSLLNSVQSAFSLAFNSSNISSVNSNYRCYGFSVRAVQ